VAKMLKESGFGLICADEVSKQVSDQPNTLSEIRSNFGEEVFTDAGILDRQKLGDIVFKDRAKRQILNKIYQKKVMWALLKALIYKRVVERVPFVFMDVPLLFESCLFAWVMFPILVVTIDDEEVIVERLMKRNDFNREQALNRIHA
jgi:dephospho-CoA kinase